MNKIIPIGCTVAGAGMAVATATVGNWGIASLFVAAPAVYWVVVLTQRAKRISAERRKVREQAAEDARKELLKHRDVQREREHLQSYARAQQDYHARAAQQRQAFNNMHAQQLAAQQSAGMANARYGYGYSDPRVVHQQSALSDPFFNAVLANSLSDALTAGMGVTRTRVEETGEVKIEHVPVREVYRSADPEPERSSSSSYSSDTSSDSFSSSDTGSDSF